MGFEKKVAGDDFWWILSQNEKADPSFFSHGLILFFFSRGLFEEAVPLITSLANVASNEEMMA